MSTTTTLNTDYPTSANHATALKWLSAISAFDNEANLALRAPDCRHTIIPASLGFSPNMSNDEWLGVVIYLASVLSRLDLKPIEALVADKQVTLWTKGTTEVKPELRDSEEGDWVSSGDAAFTLTFNDEGRINHIFEMLDSAQFHQASPFMARAAQNLSKQGKI